MRRRCHPIPGFVGLWLLALMSEWGAFTVGATSAVGADASPDAFVSRFVAAINSARRSAQITALIDSRSLKCLSGEAAELLSFTIANWIKAPISAQYKVQIDDLGPEAPLLMDAFMPGRFVYPARPTRKVQISAEVTASSGRLIIAEIGLDAGEWKVDLACPKEGTVAWMKQTREEGIEQGKVSRRAYREPESRLADRNELVSMAKSGHLDRRRAQDRKGPSGRVNDRGSRDEEARLLQ